MILARTALVRTALKHWSGWVALCFGGALLAAAARGDNWPQFRGAERDNISKETGLLRKWPEGGPKVLWSVPACQGYAAGAIYGARVYFEDYDRDAKEWSLRCLGLADGKELWRLSESKTIRPNHGITRASPATDGKYVFALDPKCVFHCVDADTGKRVWRKDLVEEYKTQIPPWYNGQNPLIEAERVVLGVGGDALVVAFDKATGNEIWRTPNPDNWPLSHSSVMPAELGGVKQYVWCTLMGLLGVRAEDGKLLWRHPRKFNVAVAPSPLPIGDDRVFMTSGYDAGSVMIRVKNEGGEFKTETVFELTSEEWNSEVHTPILWQKHLFAVGRKQRGLFTCLDLDGKVVWTSAGKADFDLGSFVLGDGVFYVLEGKTGMLRMLEANTTEYRELDQAQVLGGDNVWGPIALSDGRMVLRDMTKMVCIEVGGVVRARAGGTPLVCLLAGLGNANCLQSRLAADESKMRYHKLRTISGRGSGQGEFAETLRGLAIDGADRLYAVGDTKVCVFSETGELAASWATERPGHCVGVAAEGSVYVGEEGQVEVFDRAGKRIDVWRDAEKLGLVTAVGFTSDNVVLADTQDRCLRRYDKSGKFRNDIGKDGKMRGFLIPNRHLDFVVDRAGVIRVVNPGMHRVQGFTLDGKLVGQFGHFDGVDPAGFGGCCNPTNIALTPQGNFVVTEKAGPRVKVYDAEGDFVTVVAADDFDVACKNMDVVVDSRGRIYVGDTVRLQVLVYEPDVAATQAATRESRP